MMTTEESAYVAWMDDEYERWESEHSEQLEREAHAAWVERLCEGHESLRGDMMGAEEYCDGTCRPLEERDHAAWVEAIESDCC